MRGKTEIKNSFVDIEGILRTDRYKHGPFQFNRIILGVAQQGYCSDDKVFHLGKFIVNNLSYYPGEIYVR